MTSNPKVPMTKLAKIADDQHGSGKLNGLRVLMFIQRAWGKRIGHPIAKDLARNGARLAAFVEKKETYDFVCRQDDVDYSPILVYEEIMNRPRDFIIDGVDESSICKDLDIDSIWPIATTEHNLARRYAGKYHYQNVQNMDDDFIVDYMRGMHSQIRKLFDDFRPHIVVSPNFVAPNHLITEFLARQRGIRMLAVTHTRISGIYSFCYDHKLHDGRGIRRVKALQAREATSSRMDDAYEFIASFRKKFAQPLYQERIKQAARKNSLPRRTLIAVKQSVRYMLKGGINPIPAIGITPDNLSPYYIFRDLFMSWKYRRQADRFPYYDLNKLGRYAYCPLQMQPEALIDTISGQFNNQFEVARLTAKSLPDDLTLVVKDHPSMIGKRGTKFYDKLMRTPNIKVIDHRTPSSELLQNCEIVISPGGTTVVEGAYFRKPAIQFSDIGVTQLLPNVVTHSDFSTLPARIREIMGMEISPEEYDFQLACFIAGAMDVGFEADHDGLWVYGYEINMKTLYDHFEREIVDSCAETGQWRPAAANDTSKSAAVGLDFNEV